jgi:hypothetical protein
MAYAKAMAAHVPTFTSQVRRAPTAALHPNLIPVHKLLACLLACLQGIGAQDLNRLQQAVSALTSPSSVVWLPSYGCALLALPTSPAALEQDKHSVQLVGLDSWAHDVHHTRSVRCAGARSLRFHSSTQRLALVVPALSTLPWLH